MHLLSKIDVNLVSSCHSCVHLYMVVPSIITFHLVCIHDSYAMHMHAIGVSEGVTLLEFEQGLPEEQQQVKEQEVQGPEGGVNEEVLECPDHQPSTFLKGKPRSILSLLCFENNYFEYLYMFDALSDRSWMQTLVAYLSIPCLVNVP